MDFDKIVNDAVLEIKERFIAKVLKLPEEHKDANINELISLATTTAINFNIELTTKSLELYHKELIISLNSLNSHK